MAWYRVLRFGAGASGPYWLPAAAVTVTGATTDVPEAPGVPGEPAPPAATHDTVTLTWTAPTTGGTVTGYRLWRQTGAEAFTVLGADLAADVLTHADTTVAGGTAYRYRVQALSAAGAGAHTPAVAVTTPATPREPGMPTALAAAPGADSRMQLGWTAPADAGTQPITGYRIERAAAAATLDWVAAAADTGNADTTWSDNNLAADAVHHYRVRARNGVGAGDPSAATAGTTRPQAALSATATYPLTAHRQPSATAPTSHTWTAHDAVVQLDIVAQGTGEGGRWYRVLRFGRSAGGPYWLPAAAVTVTGSTAAVTRVPAAPTALSAAPGADSQMQLRWTAPPAGSAPTGYRIERSADVMPRVWTEAAADTGTTDTTWSDRGLAAATTYRYRVTGRNAAGLGVPSTEAAGRTRPQLRLRADATLPLAARAWPEAEAPATHTWNAYDAAVVLDVVGQGAGGGHWYRALRFGQATAGPYWLPAAAVAVTGSTADLPQAPDPPGNLAATATHNTATLTWTAPALGGAVTGQRLWRQTDAGAWEVHGEDLAADLRTFTDTALAADTTYRYRVQALAAAGAGARSAPVAVATAPPPPLPGVPRRLSVSVVAARVRLLWRPPTAGDPVTGYRLWRRTGTDGPFVRLGEDLGPRAHGAIGSLRAGFDAAVVSGATYAYRVQALGAHGAGPLTGSVTVTLP